MNKDLYNDKNRENFIVQHKSLTKKIDNLILVKKGKVSMKSRFISMYKSFFNASS